MKRKIYHIQAGSHQLTLGQRTLIMGIINMTPDSFSQDGLAGSLQKAQRQAARMIREGADILDIGGESSRPGSVRVSTEEERQRVIPLVKLLVAKIKIPISVDTYKPRIAREALDSGASIINTIKGVDPDKSLLRMIRDYKAAIVLMHMRGIPRTMQKRVGYRDVVKDISEELRRSIKTCLDIGIEKNQIIIDPGIGFGKTVEHNLEILRRLNEFSKLGCPVLIGVSRKSFIGEILGQPVGKRLYGSLAAACLASCQGSHLVRCHDVTETYQAIRLIDQVYYA